MKQFLLYFSLALLTFCICGGIFLTQTADAVADAALRLHVIANSDSDTDQAAKLAVRDAVLETLSALTQNCTDKAAVLEIVNANTDTLQSAAAETLAARGSRHAVSVQLCKEAYPTRVYTDVTLPAGVYDSLQVRIGAAEGKNWWCVLFPPLCTGVAEAKEELFETGFTPGQVKLICDPDAIDYTIKFKVVEWAQALRGKQ